MRRNETDMRGMCMRAQPGKTPRRPMGQRPRCAQTLFSPPDDAAFDTPPLFAVRFRMRFAAVRHAASLVLALVWAGARLAQPLQPDCPHHAAVLAAAPGPSVVAPASGPDAPTAHAHHAEHAPAAPSSYPSPEPEPEPQPEPEPEHEHGTPAAPCECAAQCCAAGTVAVPAAAWRVSLPTRVGEAPFLVPTPRAPDLSRLAHRQPPANAPPDRHTV
jgi:hypothetical protein